MISIEFTSTDLDTLHNEMRSNPDERSRPKCMVLYMKGTGWSHQKIAEFLRISQDMVKNYIIKYAKGGLKELLADNYYKPTGRLEPYIKELEEKQQFPLMLLTGLIQGILFLVFVLFFKKMTE